MPTDDAISRAELRDLVGIEELRELLGRTSRRGERVARSYAVSIANGRNFPAPVVEHPTSDDPRIRLWLRRDVESWLDTHRPGWRDAPPVG